MKPAASPRETGWLPDCVLVGERFEAGLAFFADELGRIVRFSREPADLDAARRLEGQAALPGLVNAHSQALRRLDRGRVVPAGMTSLSTDDVHDAARMAFLEMLLSGITCVGEWGVLPGLDAPAEMAMLRAARDVGIRLALFHGARDGAQLVDDMERLRRHVASEHPGDLTWLGIGVAAAEAQPVAGIKAIAAQAHAHRHRLQIHHSGDPTAWQRSYGRSYVAHLGGEALLDKRVTIVPAEGLTSEDARLLGAARALVCACPLARHGTARVASDLAALRAAGVEVAVGTDDQQRVNLLEAMRVTADGGTAAQRLHAATVAGARSLGAPSGALEVGRPADFFTVNLYDPSLAGASPEGLLDAIVVAAERRAIREVWVGARPRITNGRHPQQGPIVGRFVELSRRMGA